MEAEPDVKPKPSQRNMKFLVPAPPDSPPNLQRAFARYITVEPVLFLTATGFGIVLMLLPQFLQQAVALEQNMTLPEDDDSINGTCVNRNTSDPYYVRLEEVQAAVAYWQMVISMCGDLPAIIVAPVWGAYSDSVGRKCIFGLILSGYMVFCVSFMLVYYLSLPMWILPVAKLIEGEYKSDIIEFIIPHLLMLKCLHDLCPPYMQNLIKQ